LANTPASFGDSGDYRWKWAATVRPYGLSLFFSVLKNDSARVVVQTIIGSLLWCWLFTELSKWLVGQTRARYLVIGTAVTLSLSRPILMWDRVVLSESLALGLLAAASAAALGVLRVNDNRSRLRFAGVLLAISFVRETVLLSWGLPLAVLVTLSTFKSAKTTLRSWLFPPSGHLGFRRFERLSVVFTGLIFLFGLTALAFNPTTAKYGPNGATIANYRTMNLIGVRILPDPYLRDEMRKAGMPEADPSLAGAFSFSNDWNLYKSPGMLNFANDFPNAAYIVAEMSRPWPFYTYLLPALDAVTTKSLDQYGTGSYEFVPRSVNSILWGWSGTLHLAILLTCLFAYLRAKSLLASRFATGPCFELTGPNSAALRDPSAGSFPTGKPDREPPDQSPLLATDPANPSRFDRFLFENRQLIGGLLIGGTLGSTGALAGRVFDTMEQARHALPFHLLARFSLLLLCALAISAALGRTDSKESRPENL
jgi:hypothetical protein